MSIIAVAAMMFVSCKKEDTKTDGNEQKQETVDPELVGTWTIVGKANGWDETAGVAMTESDNVWTVAEVAIKGEGFKFVKDGSWDINLGASPKTGSTQKFDDDVEFDLEKGGDNIAGAKDGIYSVTLNLLTKKAYIKFLRDLPVLEPVAIDGDMSDWADVSTGITHTGGALVEFKVAKGAENLYFYAKRDETRIADIWGGNGYLYFCLDLDNDATTGDGELWGNGPYEAVMALFPYAGTASAPEFSFKSDSAIMPATFSIKNAKLAGKVTDGVGVEVEISIPLADLPAIPETEFSIYTWGNKGADDAHQKWTGTL